MRGCDAITMDILKARENTVLSFPEKKIIFILNKFLISGKILITCKEFDFMLSSEISAYQKQIQCKNE